MDLIKYRAGRLIPAEREEMKIFMVEYTEDFGATSRTEFVNANTFTEAYVSVELKLSKDGAITDCFEIK